jgi:ComF family protein
LWEYEPMPDALRLWWHRWPRELAGALLPSCCALCGEVCGKAVCSPCHHQYVVRRVRCPRCANPLPVGAEGLCGGCLADPPAFDATVAAADYEPPLDQLVLQLKFGARLALAPWFAQLLRDAVLAQPDAVLPELLCPVPLGAQRLVERGFNQALEVAKPLAMSLGVPLQPRLTQRVVETRAQSGVSPAERKENIRGAFAPTPELADVVAGRHIGVVDDVMTSGSTLNELAAALKQAGAHRVTNLVFARTPPH